MKRIKEIIFLLVFATLFLWGCGWNCSLLEDCGKPCVTSKCSTCVTPQKRVLPKPVITPPIKNNCNGSCCNCKETLKGKFCKPCRKYIFVVGRGAPPNDENLSEVQRYLLAERAAIVDGYRQLAEKLQGFIVSTLTKAGNYVINKDVIKVEAEAMIRGAEVIEVEHKDNGVCSAKIRILLPEEQRILAAYNEYLTVQY